MTPEGRRAVRRLAFTAISAAAGYAVSGASARQALRVPLGVLAVASLGNLGMQVKTASKAYATESRFNNLINNGGSFGGNVVVNGNHTITGSLFGSAGTITAGDAIHVNGNPLTADGTITSHADINATTGTITGGTVASNGTITASGTISNSSGNINTNGNVNASGAISGGSTTGVGGQGAASPGDKFTTTIPGGTAFTASASTWLVSFQGQHNSTVDDLQSAINRINDLLSALG